MAGGERVMLRCVSTVVDAHFLKGYLAAGGIESEIVGDGAHPLGAMPHAPAFELWVAAADRERAALLLSQAEQGPADGEQSVLCVNCGEENPSNFEVCWKCGGFTRVEGRSHAHHTAPTPAATFMTQKGMMGAVALGILVLVLWSTLR